MTLVVFLQEDEDVLSVFRNLMIFCETAPLVLIQWNPSCEATPFAPEKWPFKRGGLRSGVEINTFMFKFTLLSGLSRGGGLSSGWPLKRGSTVEVKA